MIGQTPTAIDTDRSDRDNPRPSVPGGATRPASFGTRGEASLRHTMTILTNVASRLFGVALIFLSVFVSIETLARKLLNFSFEGADELGGYVLAIGSSLAFVVALVDRAHIRIDVVHQHLPTKLQAVMDWLSIVSLAALGLFILYVGRIVISDTLAYGSTAPTPWATPLIVPQSLWYGALCLFALVALILALKATVAMLRGRLDTIAAEFHPKGAIEELSEELGDIARR